MIGTALNERSFQPVLSFQGPFFLLPVFRLAAFFPFKAPLSVSLFPLLYFSSLFFTFAVFSFCFSPPPWGSIFFFPFSSIQFLFFFSNLLNSSAIFGEERDCAGEKPLQQGGT